MGSAPQPFLTALAAGKLDQCLLQLRDDDSAGPNDAELTCLLAEALFHHGRREEALECCRRALPAAGGNAVALGVCAWVFNNSACHAEAVEAYSALIALRPEAATYRHASSSLMALGQIDDAIAHAAAASDQAPQNGEFALNAGSLLSAGRRFGEAAHYLRRAVALLPDAGAALCRLSIACNALGRTEEAATLARRAGAAPDLDAGIAADAAEVLMSCGRLDDASEMLRRVVDRFTDPRLWRVLSSAEMLCDRIGAALAAVDEALALAPKVAEYHAHRAQLLGRLGDSDGAIGAFDTALQLDPANGAIRRAQMALYLAGGQISEATATAGELLCRFPDDRPAAEAVFHLLSHRLDTIDGEFVVLNDGIPRTSRPARRPPTLLERFATQRRVIGALIIRETRTRYADYRLGYGWALIEPILHITLLSTTFAVLMHGRPPIGTHFFLFYYTGLIPYPPGSASVQTLW